MNIRTKWHKIMELARKGELYFVSPPDGKATRIDEMPNHLPLIMRAQWLLDCWSTFPKFVIDPELLHMARDEEYASSLVDMKRAGVLRLPFSEMVVEMPAPTGMGGHVAAILCDAKSLKEVATNPDGSSADFVGFCVHLNSDGQGEYIALSPGVTYITIEDRGGEPWVGITGVAGAIFDSRNDLAKIVESTFSKCAGSVYHGIFAAMLLMSTAGVAKEVIECERLNKKRALSNKPPIPRHTYIRIGHVYKSAKGDEREEYIPRRSPRPHWRRGHLRHVHYGTGREKIKQVFIQPRLVAYKHDTLEPEPKAPSYTVKV